MDRERGMHAWGLAVNTGQTCCIQFNAGSPGLYPSDSLPPNLTLLSLPFHTATTVLQD